MKPAKTGPLVPQAHSGRKAKKLAQTRMVSAVARMRILPGDNAKNTREQRLAEKLRENLKRRKSQARVRRDSEAKPSTPVQKTEKS